MRRTLAISLAAAVLLAGGCARRQPAADQPARPAPAAATSPAAKSAAKTAATTESAPVAPADVDGLLDEIDKQLAGDSQPTEDQD